jgi:hypothetical protein
MSFARSDRPSFDLTVNYALVRIEPPKGAKVDAARRRVAALPAA